MRGCARLAAAASMTLLGVAALAAEPVAAEEETPTAVAGGLTLDEAIRTALSKNARLKASDHSIEAARYAEKSMMARFLPMVRLDGNVIVWDSALELAFVEGGGAMQLPPPAPDDPYEQAFFGMLQGLGAPTTIRDQVTAEIGASIIQPLTPLITYGDAEDLFELGIRAEQIKKAKLEHDIALQTTVAYWRFLQARTMLATAEEAVTEIEAQLARVENLLKRGVVGENDRLALQVALAARRQAVIKTETQIAVARAGLALSMGLPIDSHVEPVPLATRAIPQPSEPLVEAYRLALERRQDLQELDAGVKQTEYALELEQAKHTPTVSAIAKYTHAEGSSFSEADSFFVGLFLEWNAFEWGATQYGVKQAEARVAMVKRQGEALREVVRFQVKQTRLELESSVKALEVADGAVELAERSLELESKRLAAGDSTATDLLAAETALNTARNNRTAAYYQTLVAHASYQQAIGAPLTATTLIPGGSDARPTP